MPTALPSRRALCILPIGIKRRMTYEDFWRKASSCYPVCEYYHARLHPLVTKPYEISGLTKLIAAILASIVLTLFFTGCSDGSGKPVGINQIKSYRDIPGISEEESSAIEAFRTSGREFTFGVLDSTEAFLSNSGERDGFTILLGELLTELFGINFKVEAYGWSELIANLEDMTIDFTGETTPTAVRQGSRNELFEVDGEMVPGKEYIMSAPIAERMLRIFTRADSHIRHEVDLAGLRVGFLEGTTTAREIKQSYRIDFATVEIIVPDDAADGVDDYYIAVQMLERGEIDAFVEEATADPAFEKYNKEKQTIRSSVFFPMVHSPVSMTTTNIELKPIISAVDKYLAAGGTDRLYELYMEGEFRYEKHKLHNSFTPEEKAYLEELARRGTTVSVAYEHDHYPVDFYNHEDGMFQGIAVDILSEVSKLTGIKFEPAFPNNTVWAVIYEKLLTGEVDMAAQLLYSEQRAEYFIWSVEPYARTYYALMARSDSPFFALHQVPRLIVGTIKSSGMLDIYRELFPHNNNLIEYDTQYEALEALEQGDIDLLMASEYNLLAVINYLERSGVKINTRLDVRMESYFGFYKGNTVLRSIIDKSQQFIDTEQIEMSWIGRQFDYSKKMAEERALYMSIFIGFMALLTFAMAFVLVRNVKLGKTLKEMAHNDALTGIFNRRHFMELAAIQASRSERTNIDCFAVMFDLDHFKSVNDTYGHLAGDKVLKETAWRVKCNIRPYDILGRYGGEEFIILMSDAKEIKKENVLNAAERIRLAVGGAPVEFEGTEIPITASFGVAYAAPRNSISMAIKYADEALYKAKESGRNKVVFSDSVMQDDNKGNPG